MNIFNLFFEKKTKKVKNNFETIPAFLERKFTPIAKYIYHGNLIISEYPIVINNCLYFQIYFIGENSKNIGEMKISVNDVFEWTNILKSKEEK